MNFLPHMRLLAQWSGSSFLSLGHPNESLFKAENNPAFTDGEFDRFALGGAVEHGSLGGRARTMNPARMTKNRMSYSLFGDLLVEGKHQGLLGRHPARAIN